MRFKNGTVVRKAFEKGKFLEGTVLGTLQSLTGVIFCVCETADNQIFTGLEGKLELVRASQLRENCDHQIGFYLSSRDMQWHCNMGCGYALNFDPAHPNVWYVEYSGPSKKISLKKPTF